MTRIYKRIVYTTQWWQNQSTGRSMGSFNPSYALHSLQCTSSSIGSLPSQTVTFSRLKSFPTRLSFCVLKKYSLSFDIRCFLWYEQMQWKRWTNTKKTCRPSFFTQLVAYKSIFWKTWSRASNSRYAWKSVFKDGYRSVPVNRRPVIF